MFVDQIAIAIFFFWVEKRGYYLKETKVYITLVATLRVHSLVSPYLFILCLERLSIQLSEAAQNKQLHPISFRGRVRLSHLFFADDIFLFTRATTKDCRNLGQILSRFCESSGQLISLTKPFTVGYLCLMAKIFQQ